MIEWWLMWCFWCSFRTCEWIDLSYLLLVSSRGLLLEKEAFQSSALRMSFLRLYFRSISDGSSNFSLCWLSVIMFPRQDRQRPMITTGFENEWSDQPLLQLIARCDVCSIWPLRTLLLGVCREISNWHRQRLCQSSGNRMRISTVLLSKIFEADGPG